MDNGPERQAIVDEMVEMLRHDAPWVWGLHPKDYSLAHRWVFNRKPNKMANNGIKYVRVDPALREASQRAWNRPVVWPIVAVVVVLLIGILPALIVYRRRERSGALTPVHGAS
jgi:oligopeptide transport system substrate-binding protein